MLVPPFLQFSGYSVVCAPSGAGGAMVSNCSLYVSTGWHLTAKHAKHKGLLGFGAFSGTRSHPATSSKP